MEKIKYVIAVVFFVFLIAGVAVNINLSNHATRINNLVLNNMEALGQGETSGEQCGGSGTITCDGSSTYRSKYDL